MKVLVTGVAGFIGAGLTSKLLAAGHQVVGVDNFNDYYTPELIDLVNKRYTADLRQFNYGFEI